MLDYESKVLDAIDVRKTLIKLIENEKGLRLKLQAIMKEIERLKNMVSVLDKATIKCSSI